MPKQLLLIVTTELITIISILIIWIMVVHTYFFIGEPDKDSLIAQNITSKLYLCVRLVSVNKPGSEKIHETIRESHKTIRCAVFNIIFLLKIVYYHLYSYLLLNSYRLFFSSCSILIYVDFSVDTSFTFYLFCLVKWGIRSHQSGSALHCSPSNRPSVNMLGISKCIKNDGVRSLVPVSFSDVFRRQKEREGANSGPGSELTVSSHVWWLSILQNSM